MRHVLVFVSAVFVSSLAMASTSLNVQNSLFEFLPQLNTNSTLQSLDKNCTLSLSDNNEYLQLSLKQAELKEVQVVLPKTLKPHNELVEPKGKSVGQGNYSYAKYNFSGQALNVVLGAYYYEPSYEPEDSLVETLFERQMTIVRRANAVEVKLMDRQSGFVRSSSCQF